MRASQRKLKEFLSLTKGFEAGVQQVSRDSLDIKWTRHWEIVSVKWHPDDHHWTINYSNWNEQYKPYASTREHPLSCTDIDLLLKKIKLRYRNWANYHE